MIWPCQVAMLVSTTAHAGISPHICWNAAFSIQSIHHAALHSSKTSSLKSVLQWSWEPFRIPFGWRGVWDRWMNHFLLELRVYWSEYGVRYTTAEAANSNFKLFSFILSCAFLLFYDIQYFILFETLTLFWIQYAL